MHNLYDLPFDEYMVARYNKAVDSGFFNLFPQSDSLIFAQAMWAKQYWFAKNGGEKI